MNPKHKLFCEEYMQNGKNGRQAYIKVYNPKSESGADASASRLLNNVKVIEYLAELEEEVKKQVIMSIEEKRIWLAGVIKGDVTEKCYDSDGNEYKKEASLNDKMKALDIDNKMVSAYTENINVAGRIETNPYNNLTEEQLRKLSDG